MVKDDNEHLRVPDLRVAETTYHLELDPSNKTLKDELMAWIEKYDMAAYYKYLLENKPNLLQKNSSLIKKLEKNIKDKLKEIDDKIVVAEREEGETEVRDLQIQKGEYLAKSGDRIGAIKIFKEIRRGPHVTSNCKLDLAFIQLRMALFYNDDFIDEADILADKLERERLEKEEKEKKEAAEKKRLEIEEKRKKEKLEAEQKLGKKSKAQAEEEENITDKEKIAAEKKKRAKEKKEAKEKEESKKSQPMITNYHSYAENIVETKRLVEEAGDWDRRNRVKVYEAIHLVQSREFAKAAPLFLDSVPTFTSTELITYGTLVSYATLTALLCSSRKGLKKDLIDSSDIQEQLYGLPLIRDYLNSFYNCQYDQFFINLAKIENVLKKDRYFNQHVQFYIREMRLNAYKQVLASYSSLAIDYMANAFGVTPDFIDYELSRFIASGRIPAKIDHVAGIVVTNRPDLKNQQYRNVVKKGDSLLNRVQKLSRVINI